MGCGRCAIAILLVSSTSIGASSPPGEEIRLSRSRRGLPVVTVTAGAATLRMGIDTGTSRTLVSAEAAGRLGLRAVQRLSIDCAAGERRVGFCGAAPTLTLAGLALVPDCLGWLPGEAQLRGAEDLDGILGADLLAQVDLWIDLRSVPVSARFAPPASLSPWVDGERLPLESIGGRAAIAARLAGLRREGSTTRLILDSGSDSLVLFGQAAQRTAGTFPHERFESRVETAAANRAVVIVPLSGVRIGGSLFALPWAALLPEVTNRSEDGLLPLDALGPVLLDLSTGIVVANARLRSAPRIESLNSRFGR
jgi:hypothetical protein